MILFFYYSLNLVSKIYSFFKDKIISLIPKLQHVFSMQYDPKHQLLNINTFRLKKVTVFCNYFQIQLIFVSQSIIKSMKKNLNQFHFIKLILVDINLQTFLTILPSLFMRVF
jgi:hypothetical protein